MSSKEKTFMSMAELVKLARVKSSSAVAEQYRQSLPIPLMQFQELRVVFLYCPALALPKQPVKMNPPQYMLRLSAATGSLEELRAVTPGDFGQPHGPSDLIGTFSMPEGMTFEQFMLKQDRLYKVYDLLMPDFAAKRSPVGQETSAAAKEFEQLFLTLSEPPLKPYYRASGKEFFDWVGQVAR